MNAMQVYPSERRAHTKTRISIFIKVKLKKSDGQSNIDKYRLSGCTAHEN